MKEIVKFVMLIDKQKKNKKELFYLDLGPSYIGLKPTGHREQCFKNNFAITDGGIFLADKCHA